MNNIPTLEVSVMTDDPDSQVPKVALSMGCSAYIHAMESLALLAIQGNYIGGLLYGASGEVAKGLCQKTWDAMPHLITKVPDNRVAPGYAREVDYKPPSPDEGELHRLMWTLAPLREYALFRNRMRHAHIVGDRPYTQPLVYAALRVMHEYRCEDIRQSIMRSGPKVGSATAWWNDNWKDEVTDWPVRWNFKPMFWTPLFNEVEGNSYYTGALGEWERKQSMKELVK